ncbi:SDR family NAD(P)-dependent oxidoreductase [Rhizobium hidalgonense]|uniref:SDR family NAD(P)-dependent oxidoreductase n=1 Tax=Rhizobium hidalgonense TaxID=1538159 RepID=A0AAJ2GVW5_9HYPH|nr:SDR family NAD(P)-dependent oxidoreductase [Rhizobium hidalgonense]MDR9776902.1 SDR family NAD(P)-dependent oxidoreductase [Rhizobium hidalgonense]MDR9813945.1 SDR family NAD(P)-dependent oxidoreductase [Rhizobium hidalgonense]MDR9820737.1 SDR family NAD(P)-dependent oxidoreductase [Rhizobium hidalgonense]
MQAVALVTGGSRGVGRGIALALLEEGATVHVTARTVTEAEARVHPQGAGSLESLVEEASGLPGQLTVHRCDHALDEQTMAVVAKIDSLHGGIDILVNNAWPGYEHMVEGTTFTWPLPFWEQPMWRWNAMIDVGLRSAFVASRAATPSMIARKSGLIVNISFWAAELFEGNAIYGVAKAGANKLAADCAHDLMPHGVSALALYPGLVRTEAVMRAAEFMDLSNSESPRFVGRVIARLWNDSALLEKSGRPHVVAELAREYGVVDIDGNRPKPLVREDFMK